MLYEWLCHCAEYELAREWILKNIVWVVVSLCRVWASPWMDIEEHCMNGCVTVQSMS